MARTSKPSQPLSPQIDQSAAEVERTAFVERLKAIAEMVGSVSALAKRAGLSQAGLRSYLHSSDPTRRVMAAIADAAGVSRNWLANGDVAMLGPDSPLREEALGVVREAWETFGRDRQLKGATAAAWGSFVQAYRADAIGLGIPGWVRFALPNIEAVRGRVVGGAAASSSRQEITRHAAFGPRRDEGVSDAAKDLLQTVSREWRRLASSQLNVNSDKDPFGDVYDQVLVSAYEELSAIASQLGQHPAVQTIRVVLMSQLLRLDPVAGDALRYEAEAELAEV